MHTVRTDMASRLVGSARPGSVGEVFGEIGSPSATHYTLYITAAGCKVGPVRLIGRHQVVRSPKIGVKQYYSLPTEVATL